LIDYVIYKLIKVWLPKALGFIVIGDRNLLDILVDVYTEINAMPRILVRYLSHEIKSSEENIVILASLQNLLLRRKQNLCNPYIRSILKLYKYLGKIYGYKMYYNDVPSDLAKIFHPIISRFQPVRVYADPQNQLIRALFYKHRWMMYVANFLFQSMGYMWKVELMFRLTIQVLAMLFLIVLGMHPLLALPTSHILLYPLYTNFFAIAKWLNESEKDIDREKVIQGIKKLESIQRSYGSYIDVIVVGSLAHNPKILLVKKVDIDVRIVPKTGFKCLLLSLFLAIYLRLWSIFHRVPMDLYIKPREDLYVQDKRFLPLKDFLMILKGVKKMAIP